MAVKVGMISLGCAKNQVDGELLMAKLKAAGYELVDDVAMADVAIVNTCGFIESAQKESIDEILELGMLKKEGRIKKLVATGCLVERFQGEMRKELPELDGVLGIGANEDPVKYLRDMLESGPIEAFPEKEKLPLSGDRELTTPSWSAYLKIAEGCDNRCSYCAIPYIRGGYRSRTMEDIEQEARALARNGARELVLIAQDTTRYGIDLYGEYSLAKLLKRLSGIEGIKWLRVLYCYPDAITDELLEVMAGEEKILPYIDLPLQHCSGKVLRAMNRRGDRESLEALIEKIRSKVPGVILRTTLITGFPGETEEDFTQLSEFVKTVKFDRLGCFTYSREEGTPAASLPDQLDQEEKERRAGIIAEQQMDITGEKGEALIGKTVEVLVEGFDRYAECWFGRSYMDAPDVDGKIFFTAPEKRPTLGSFVQVKIEDCMEGDLTGSLELNV
ncbi:MAG: 30S ribosomal protein S12 methylthiotransferase RimO [Acutalibacter sp.]|jgi:ribosomal protein S12 methylthiotransferase|uniref:30S ribosomal protein S12 methylthiotransferase RimO n=1 Tax=Acutalibacter sp. TaxID=1918636 RepID=UPI002172AE1B|nr:30S ribosomal protein S12 methylthiotransferase RimO [Acutalibacter sp.]MCI9225092.1 30S ribosomal protein S12 methylthiotransferase RimO [Acutalibacter sp.]